MVDSQIYVGASPLSASQREVKGDYILIEDESFYRIDNSDMFGPFFMTLVSSSDHWMFIASNGALTAGRSNPESALFPYYTDDKIMEAPEMSGSKTILRVSLDGKVFLWEPFSKRYRGVYTTRQNLYKNRTGNKLIFEELNEDLGLSFSYTWTFTESYGFCKRSELKNITQSPLDVEVLDGIRNIMPYGISSTLQNQRSTLADAYKRNELEEQTGLGMFSLSSMIVDKAEPSEALKCTSVCAVGSEVNQYLLSSDQLWKFRKGLPLSQETDVKARKGAYYICASHHLPSGNSERWYFLADVNQGPTELASKQLKLKDHAQLIVEVEREIAENTQKLNQLVGLADGLQLSNDQLGTGRHYTNVLFNIMRGGIFEDQYAIDIQDFTNFLATANREVYLEFKSFLAALPQSISYYDLRNSPEISAHPDALRLTLEYLPLSFSRRHGDPSRPWNSFNIHLSDENGNKIRNFEGNWRDIFQNWEALLYSFPEYIEGVITKFVNASTIDGYNPYRISRKGIDWEVIEPDDPWSYIGYWGDHQLIYLLKLLEHAENHYPGKVKEMMRTSHFVYARVPYRIKSYPNILRNPFDTVDYDHSLAKDVETRTEILGADGKLVPLTETLFLKANLTEKLLVSLLTKLYNFVPEAGIWLNTQRPEWNDANNALVGNGASMVTLYYARRFVNYLNGILTGMGNIPVEVNKPVQELWQDIFSVFTTYQDHLEGNISPQERKTMCDLLGTAGDKYRAKAYSGFSGEQAGIRISELQDFLHLMRKHLDHSIEVNRREDGLFHSYNILHFDVDKIEVSVLNEMLEGQVAVLSSGFLNATESSVLLDKLKESPIYRADQYSYMLYPIKELKSFLTKNVISDSLLKQSPFAQSLLSSPQSSILSRDEMGVCHFNPNFHNVNDLKSSLHALELARGSNFSLAEKRELEEIFEAVFKHKSYTGRSGTFFGYEGIGSIYWHMVSKLLLAVQENIYQGSENDVSAEHLGNLVDHYYEIRAGIGVNKSPKLYGAFPTDAYSHTPLNGGARQPGLTGQVKEDVLNRWAELGVRVHHGQIHFQPSFLAAKEFLSKSETFEYYDVNGALTALKVPQGALAFTYLGVPIVYHQAPAKSLSITLKDGSVSELSSLLVSAEMSRHMFRRNGEVVKIEIGLDLS